MTHEREPYVIVVGVDGGDGGLAALRWACAEAVATGGLVEAVHAWDTVEPSQLTRREIWIALRGMDDPPQIRHRTVNGSPTSVLVSSSAHAGLLVLGGKERSPGRLTVGPVALACRRDARCPVAIIDRSGRRLREMATDVTPPGPVRTHHRTGEIEQAFTG